jgi:membrane protease YdiL (CAAX protease family)
VYKKYDNIYVSMLMHAIHNSIYLLIYFIIW